MSSSTTGMELTSDSELPKWVRGGFEFEIALAATIGLLGSGWLLYELTTEFYPSPWWEEAFYGVDGLALYVAVNVVGYGAIGLGGTYAYLRLRGFASSMVLEVPGRRDLGLLVGASVLAPLALTAVALVAEPLDVIPIVALEFGRDAAVRGVTNPAPDGLVYWTVLAVKALLVAPAVGAVLHGVFQTTLGRVAGPVAGVAGTALLLALIEGTPLVTSGLTAAHAVVLVPMLLIVGGATGYAYERSRNLAVPLVGYALLAVAVEHLYHPVVALILGL